MAGARRRGRRWQPPSTLPPLYAPWIADLLEAPLPIESAATCQSCAMWPPAGAPATAPEFFHPDTKCCTYVPEIPNFLAGRILDDPDSGLAAGRLSFERRLDARLGVTPLGVAQPTLHAFLYQHGMPAGFGHAASLRCPHYRAEAGGACGIWRHRNGVCSTWFCKHERGATGQGFWHALEQLLVTVERTLARWCLLQIGVEPPVLARLLPRGSDRGAAPAASLAAADLDGRVNEAAYRGFWGSWMGRERELFRRAAELVNGLHWPDVVRLGGASVEGYARVVIHAHQQHGARQVPARLAVAPLTVMATSRERVRIETYSPYDPLELPRLLVDALCYFDGRPTAEALRRIRQERRINVQPDLLRRLVDFGVLIEPA